MPDDDDENRRAQGGGGSRNTDPPTAVIAAGFVDARSRLHEVLRYMYLLDGDPRNAWETAVGVGQPTNTISPRFVTLWRQGALEIVDQRRPGPPPARVSQQAYIITDKGRQIHRGEVELKLNPAPKPWEKKKWLRDCLWRALNDGWTVDLQDEVLHGFATYPPNREDWDAGEEDQNGGEETPE